MKRVMFDCDGVLADFIFGFTSLGHQMFGTPVISTCEQPQWDGFLEVTKEQEHAIWAHIRQDRFFWSHLPPLVSNQTFLRVNDLQNKVDVYFVTSRPGVKSGHQTATWLEHHGIHQPAVVVSRYKGEAAKVLEADFAIDDKAGNACAIAWMTRDTKTPCQSFILDRPYNQFDHAMIGSRVVRVKTVDDFLMTVEHTL